MKQQFSSNQIGDGIFSQIFFLRLKDMVGFFKLPHNKKVPSPFTTYFCAVVSVLPFVHTG